ncbi:MAG: hypothetical protein HKN87_21280 [Saprospiraceae bacterium]|nr:hypothetical protein [Saprospiraceae bacterium]
MKRLASVILFLLLASLSDTFGQTGDSYRKVRVEDLLTEAEDHYQVRFSYSKEIVPYDELVAVQISTTSLVELLQMLEEQTQIIYQKRGSRVILNVDAFAAEQEAMAVQVSAQRATDELQSQDAMLKEANLAEKQARSISVPAEKEQQGALAQQTDHLRTQEGDKEVVSVAKIADADHQEELRSERAYSEELARLEQDQNTSVLQLSFVPVPRLVEKKLEKNYHLSFNALAGYSGNLEGVEVGLFLNGIKYDVYGIQMAGLGNYVGGNVQGAQFSGFGNYNDGIMRGLQVAGFANINEQADAIQLAGAFNLNRRISRGIQGAGFFNAGRHIAGMQFAGFFNLSLGSINTQTSGFCNVAEEVDAQVSGLLNVAKKVNYVQLGVINIADTVAGASFGLLNIIRKGYNRVEFSTSETLYANLALKLGTKHFYNVFQVSTNLKRNIDRTGPVWGLGYGFGFFKQIDEGARFNPELVVMQMHENRLRNYNLNLLSQLKLLFHFNKSKGVEIFAGPVFNYSISKVYDPENNIYGSQVTPYTFWNKTYYREDKPINTKGWIGFSAGVRI